MLRRQLTPSDAPGCKRVLFSNDYYPAIANGEVSLVTNAVAKLCDKGVVTDDGVLHRADVVIYGTGFRATDFLAPMRVRGWGGVTLDEVWGRRRTHTWALQSRCSRISFSSMARTRMSVPGRSFT